MLFLVRDELVSEGRNFALTNTGGTVVEVATSRDIPSFLFRLVDNGSVVYVPSYAVFTGNMSEAEQLPTVITVKHEHYFQHGNLLGQAANKLGIDGSQDSVLQAAICL